MTTEVIHSISAAAGHRPPCSVFLRAAILRITMRPQYSSRLRRIRPRVRNEIRRYRLQVGITQRELAKRLGVRLATISDWERGMACPSLPMAIKLARLLSTLAEGLYPDFYLVQKEKRVTAEPV